MGEANTLNEGSKCSKAKFVGYLRGAAKARVYNSAQLLVVRSRQQARSIVALEAGISRKPVLLTGRCGFDEMARIGEGRAVAAMMEGLREELLNNAKSSRTALRDGD